MGRKEIYNMYHSVKVFIIQYPESFNYPRLPAGSDHANNMIGREPNKSANEISESGILIGIKVREGAKKFFLLVLK